MNDKIKRIITATIVIPPLLIIIIFSNKVFFYLVMEFFIFISLYEFIRMLKIMNYKYFKMPVILAALLMPVIVDTQNFQFLLIFLLLVVFIVFTLKLFSINPLEDTFITTGLTFVTIFYIPFFFSFLLPYKGLNIHYIFYLLFTVWMADTFAYIFGTLYGKHKLYEKISPKKTIEGFIASYFGGLITAAIYNAIFIKFPIVDVFFSTLLIVSAGTTGDLVESMFKRQCHLKNSGTFFPGHGGILDRIDSLLFAIPVFYIYITYRFAQ